MRFSQNNLLLGATALFAVAAADDCSDGPFGEKQWFGRPSDQEGGVPFCDTKWKSGAVVTGVEAWSNKWHVKGIQLSYSDGSKGPVHGQTEGDWTPNPNFMGWGEEEQVTRLQRWGNWNEGDGADGVGKIAITVGGKSLEVGSDVGKYGGEPVLTHSGTILGIAGRQGQWLEAMEWLMLSADAGKAKIIDMEMGTSLDDWNKQKKGIKNIILSEVYIKNSNKNNATKNYTFKNGEQKTTSMTISHGSESAFGTKVGFSVSLDAKIPVIDVGVSATVSSEVSFTHTTKTNTDLTESGTRTLEWWEQGTLLPGRAVHCKSTAFSGSYDDEYVATVEIELAGGKTVQIKQGGRYHSIEFTRAVSNCEDIPLEDAPEESEEADDPEDTPKPEDEPQEEEPTNGKRAVRFRS